MPFTPEESPNKKQAQDAANRVKDHARGNYQLAYHPDEWQMNARGELVPVIVHLSKEAGNGPVGSDGDFTPAETYYRRRGYVLIPHDVIDGEDYVAPYRNTKGRLVCRSVFQQPYDTPAGQTEWWMDAEMWAAFITLLRIRGIIRPPVPTIIQGLITQRKELLANKRAPSVNDEEKHRQYNDRCAQLRSELRVLEQEFEKSCAIYGRPAAQQRGRVLDALRSLVDGESARGAVTAEALGVRTKAAPVDEPAPPDVEVDAPAAKGKGGAPSTAAKASKATKAKPAPAATKALPNPAGVAKFKDDEEEDA